jgi:hypothetical protein
MTYIAAGALVVIVLEALIVYRLQISHLVSLRASETAWWRERAEMLTAAALERQRILEAGESERRELLNRIQHPAFVPTPQIAYEPPPTPKDLDEMGFVGMEVPDGYHVGTPPGMEIDDVNP